MDEAEPIADGQEQELGSIDTCGGGGDAIPSRSSAFTFRGPAAGDAFPESLALPAQGNFRRALKPQCDDAFCTLRTVSTSLSIRPSIEKHIPINPKPQTPRSRSTSSSKKHFTARKVPQDTARYYGIITSSSAHDRGGMQQRNCNHSVDAQRVGVVGGLHPQAGSMSAAQITTQTDGFTHGRRAGALSRGLALPQGWLGHGIPCQSCRARTRILISTPRRNGQPPNRGSYR